MDIQLGVLDTIKLSAKFVNHKILQRRLTTKETEILTTTYGQIKGVKRLTIYDDTYYAFEGIPFAKPPIKELRFRAPQPPEPWQGILDCTTCKNKPLQKHMVLNIIEGSEDCLYLNVYAKELKTPEPLPVMVWIYGGGFQIGEASRDIYSPDYFMRENVILVTINYRLGALGFLALNDPDLQVPGNAGLKDQLLALRWIKQNIANFNGDANNITLFGESAGGASTHLMMLNERARGLFHKAILQSGTALCTWATTTQAHWAYRLAYELGYRGSENEKEIFRFLTTIDASKIAGTDNRLLTLDEKNNFLLIAFGPVLEPYTSTDSVLTKNPRDCIRTTWSNEIPILIGGCSFEGLFSYRVRDRMKDLGNCEGLVPDEVKQNLSAAQKKLLGLELKRAHFGDCDPTADSSLMKFLDAMSFKYFWHGIHRTVCARLAYATQAPTYLYRFDMDSPTFNQYRILACGKDMRGVSHADDISYLFYGVPAWKLTQDQIEYKTIERMIGMWTAFARTSNPNCSQIAPTVWSATQRDNDAHKCLNISEQIEFIDLPEMPKLKVWDNLYEKELLY